MSQDICNVSFGGSTNHNDEFAFPNVCAYNEDDDLLIGPEAEKYIKQKRRRPPSQRFDQTPRPELMRYLKLALCDRMKIDRLLNIQARTFGQKTINKHINQLVSICDSRRLRPHDLIGKCISLLYRDHVAEAIRNNPAYGEQSDDWPVDIVFTRPSLWSFMQDDALTRAAQEGVKGYLNVANVALFDEASAAVIGMFTKSSERFELHDTHAVVLADLGGGTVDISCLLVEESSQIRPKFRENVAPQGACHGSTILLAHFRAEIDALLGPMYQSSAAGTSWTKICDEIMVEIAEQVRDWGMSKTSRLSNNLHGAKASKYKGARMTIFQDDLCVPASSAIKRDLEEKGYVLDEDGELSILQ